VRSALRSLADPAATAEDSAARRDGPPSMFMLAFERSMDDSHRATAEKVRSLIERGLHDRGVFRAALLSVPPAIRDGWLDVVLGLGDLRMTAPSCRGAASHTYRARSMPCCGSLNKLPCEWGGEERAEAVEISA
jgi:hypothetical protein